LKKNDHVYRSLKKEDRPRLREKKKKKCGDKWGAGEGEGEKALHTGVGAEDAGWLQRGPIKKQSIIPPWTNGDYERKRVYDRKSGGGGKKSFNYERC